MRSMKLYAKGTRYRYKHYHKSTDNEERPNLLNQVLMQKERIRYGRVILHILIQNVDIFI